MPCGYHGKILDVDLASLRTSVREIEEKDAEKYFLGSGLSALLLSSEPHRPPLDPASPLIFLAGLLTGTGVPTGVKLTVSGRSPLTGIWNEATVGGHWPVEFKFTGYDGIIFRGKAPKPVYLWIAEDKIEIRDAGDLWGKDTFETGRLLIEKTDPKARVCAIGPGGENLVAFAAITFDPPNARHAARGGVGAAMGSKNLKAIAVRGTKRPRIFDHKGMTALLRDDIPRIKEFTKGLSEFGTSGGASAVEAFGDLPVKNWALGVFPEVTKISGQQMRQTIFEKHYACWGCPIGCGKIVKGELPGYGPFHGHYPEYETVGMFGSNLLNSDLLVLSYANELCNKYGLDTISAGSVIGFAMECFEKGLITAAETGGLELAWGSAEASVSLIPQIGKREGFGGKYLADGVKAAAEKVGKGSEAFAVHTKGLEYPAHDPRGHFSMAANYATAVRGACHLEGLTYFLDRGVPAPDFGYVHSSNQFDPAGKAEICFNLQNYLSVFNPLGLCKFLFMGRVGPQAISRWISAVCGWDMNMPKLLLVGERLFNLKRMYNVRLGISGKDDVLPQRLLEGKPDGKAKGMVPPMETMLPEFYKLRGWDENGIPRPEKLAELGLI
ncbi:MAG: aldehyde ferredoxin oxidoreductase family protein [Candidatus Aureabacteria bacterium]|nr:aldehyde ferredoxin oxidoreductase family protein [Candidatus Auribacterota bacterium]